MFHSVNGVSMQEMPLQMVACKPDGAFELRAIPGKMRLFLSVRLHRDSDFANSDFRSDDDFYRSGPILELNYGENIDAKFAVRPVASIEERQSGLTKAYELANKHQLPEAIAAFTDLLAKHPDDTSALRGRASAYMRANQDREMLADFEALLKLTPDDFETQVRLAEFLSSSPIDGIRDGRRAVSLAKRAVTNLRDYQNSSEALSWALCVLAASYAETGDFENAIATQKEAIQLAPAPLNKDWQPRLTLYEAGQPYRRPTSVKSAPAPPPESTRPDNSAIERP
jgi:tetratricopeptide (TPR) repeat protein